jgi:hypothetical protein
MRPRRLAAAQHLGQWIGKSSWLGQLENVSLGHGVSLLRWRSGGVEHPHDTPPYPFCIAALLTLAAVVIGMAENSNFADWEAVPSGEAGIVLSIRFPVTGVHPV